MLRADDAISIGSLDAGSTATTWTEKPAQTPTEDWTNGARRAGKLEKSLRLARQAAATEPTHVLLDELDCDGQARREAERDLGLVSRWIRENLVYWRSNMQKRGQVFDDCIKPRGYDLGTG